MALRNFVMSKRLSFCKICIDCFVLVISFLPRPPIETALTKLGEVPH